MKRVPTGELPFWLRNAATTQLTRTPERPLPGVLAFMASLGNDLQHVTFLWMLQRARSERLARLDLQSCSRKLAADSLPLLTTPRAS